MIQNLKAKVDLFFDRFVAKYSGWLPFSGKYIRAIQAVIDKNFEALAVTLGKIAEPGSDYDKAVDFLMSFVKGNLKLPFWAAPFELIALEMLAKWLKQNKEKFVSEILATQVQ